MPAPQPKPKGKAGLVTLIGASAAALVTATVSQWEGRSLDPYRDLVGIWTVCDGETRVKMRRYTPAECDAMLQEALVDFAEPVLKRNPELQGRPHMTAAAISLTYNIGPAAYNRSTVARRFSQGRFREGCEAFMLWNRAGGKVVKGLTNRRRFERDLCLKDAA